jgi:DNA-binding transcriptional MerR regulator
LEGTGDRDDARFTLESLCERADVTVRTVRYYISEGLLPPPSGSGPAARYGQAHLDRLAVIAMLKDRYLPLREIRRTLDTLTAPDIAAMAAAAADSLAAETGPMAPTPPAAPIRAATSRHRVHEPTPADDYIATVLNQQPTRTHLPRTPPTPDARSWKRVPISGDAELLVDEATWHRKREQLESLVTWAQRILNGS